MSDWTKCIMKPKVFTFLLIFFFAIIFATLFAGVGAFTEVVGDMGYIEHYAQENDIVAADGQDLESLVKDHIAEHNESTVTYETLKETYKNNLTTKEALMKMFTGNCAIIGACGGAILGAVTGTIISLCTRGYINNNTVSVEFSNSYVETIQAGDLMFGNEHDIDNALTNRRPANVNGEAEEVKIVTIFESTRKNIKKRFTRRWGAKMRSVTFAWTLFVMFLGSFAALGAVYAGLLQPGTVIGVMAGTGVVVIVASVVIACASVGGGAAMHCRRLVASNNNNHVQSIATIAVCVLIIFIAVSRRIRRSARTRESNLMQIVLID